MPTALEFEYWVEPFGEPGLGDGSASQISATSDAGDEIVSSNWYGFEGSEGEQLLIILCAAGVIIAVIFCFSASYCCYKRCGKSISKVEIENDIFNNKQGMPQITEEGEAGNNTSVEMKDIRDTDEPEEGHIR